MILLQRYTELGRIGKEESAVMQHAVMENIEYSYLDESNLGNPPPHTLFVGSVEGVKRVLESSGFSLPKPDYYPTCLRKFLSRQIWVGKPSDVIIEIAQDRSVFAKPKNEWKLFTGQIFSPSEGYSLLSEMDSSTELWLSEVVEINCEFRVYVKNNEVLSICQYTGEDDQTPEIDLINEAVTLLAQSNFHTGTYAFDWGITSSGTTILVEVNDGFAIGRYKGISERDYHDFLRARWDELTNKV